MKDNLLTKEGFEMIKIILKQLRKAITRDTSYPAVPIRFWVGEFNQKSQYEYHQLKSLAAYLMNDVKVDMRYGE